MYDTKLLNRFRRLPEEEQNRRVIEMYQTSILKAHRSLKVVDDFSWRDVTEEEDGRLTLHVKDSARVYNSEYRLSNLTDFAGVIYSLATGSKTAESMAWDAGRKIKSPVLREIVLTLCGRNESIDPLMEKLAAPYRGEDDFFNDYTTVDEFEGIQDLRRRQRIEEAARAEECRYANRSKANLFIPSNRHWTSRWGWKLLLVLLILNIITIICINFDSGRPSNQSVSPERVERALRNTNRLRNIPKQSINATEYSIPGKQSVPVKVHEPSGLNPVKTASSIKAGPAAVSPHE